MHVFIFMGLSNRIEIVCDLGRFVFPLDGVAENTFGLSEPPEDPRKEKYFFRSAGEFLQEFMTVKTKV